MKVFQAESCCSHDSSSQGRGESSGSSVWKKKKKTRQAGPEALVSGSRFPTKFEGETFLFSLLCFTLPVCGVPEEGRASLVEWASGQARPSND